MMILDKYGKEVDLLNAGLQWRVHDDAYFNVTCIGGTVLRIPNHEVARYHSFLPDSLRIGIAYTLANSAPVDHVHKTMVRATHRLLVKGAVVLRPSDPLVFGQVFSLWENDKCGWSLRGSKLDIVEGIVSGTTIPFVYGTTLYQANVKHVDLESAYPGWHERLLCGIAMDLDDLHLMECVFTTNPVVNNDINMASVDFGT